MGRLAIAVFRRGSEGQCGAVRPMGRRAVKRKREGKKEGKRPGRGPRRAGPGGAVPFQQS